MQELETIAPEIDMYIPKHFDDSRGERAARVIRKYPLATLVMEDGRGLQANHIPLYLDPEPLPLGTLQGHIARANPIWDLERETEVLAIFQGPQSYISPSWYASKAKSGRVVPTWNYIAVHVYGTARWTDDPNFLVRQLDHLTNQNEAENGSDWQIADAPQDFLEKLMGSIVGLEITVKQVLGKFKLSQNQPEENKISVISKLSGSDNSMHREMAIAMLDDANR